ncbi:MAG: CDP-diacylglycerol diphosphatase [Bacteriovorax sp.]|nr:CDP-diacylglycerol diphosphatase [Bacteriovorax sp.]
MLISNSLKYFRHFVKIVNQECLPNQISNNQPDPCVEVLLEKGSDQGDAILKDRNGPLQYLLLPTTKITGESKAL